MLARGFDPGAPFDRILVDAPCSGLGILRRHPELKWTKRAADPGRLSRLQLQLLGENGETIYTADLGPLKVEATERIFTPSSFEQEVNAIFGDEIMLLGYDLSPPENREADLTLVWQALQTPTADYTIFVHLLNPDGSCCAWQKDSARVSGTYGTSRWLPGEVVIDPYVIALPADLPPGDYPIELGLYIAETGQRLGVEAFDGITSDALFLPPLHVP